MPQFGRSQDDSIYFASAKSIAQGHGYRILSLPGEPFQTKYPPLFPILLTLVWKFKPDFPGNLPLATLVCWLMLPMFLAASWLFYKRLGLPQWQCYFLIGLLGLNYVVVVFSVAVMPELMFSTLLLVSVILADQATGNSNSWEAFAAAVLASAAYLTKSAALPLLFSVPLLFVLRQRIRCAAVFFATMSVTVIGWNLWIYRHLLPVSDENELYYVSYWGYRSLTVSSEDLPRMIVQNARTLVLSIAESLDLHGSAGALGDAIHISITLAMIVGLFWTARRFQVSHYHAFALGYLPVLLLWHYRPNARFLLPLIPLFLGGFFHVLQEATKGVVNLIKRDTVLSVGLSLIFSAVLSLLIGVLFVSYCSTPREILPDMARWREQQRLRLPSYDLISKQIPVSSAFIAYEDSVFYLYTGHHARSLQGRPNLWDSLANFGREHKLEYLFLTTDDFDRESGSDHIRSMVDRVMQSGTDFELWSRDGGSSIYKIKKRPVVGLGDGIPNTVSQ